MRFQRTNGLEAHGVVDPATVEAMNISVYDRISVIKANLDRWRRLDYPGDHYIAVNIPEFELSYVKGGKNILTMPVIVGKPDRQTPVFSSEITRIELNPFWFVPPGMLRRTILPAVRRDSSYLEKRNMEVLDQDWRLVDPGSIDWNSVSGNEFPYIIRQRPGPATKWDR
jgi:L,D-transpeptidase YcbB